MLRQDFGLSKLRNHEEANIAFTALAPEGLGSKSQATLDCVRRSPQGGTDPGGQRRFPEPGPLVLHTLLSVDIIGLGLPFLLDPRHEGGAVWPVEAREDFFHRIVTEAFGKSREAIFFFFFGRQSSSQGLGEVLSVSKSQLYFFKRKS